MTSIPKKNKILKNEFNTVQKSFSVLAQKQKSPQSSKKIKKEAPKNRKLDPVTTQPKSSASKKTNNKKSLSSKIAITSTNVLSKKAIKIVNNTQVKKNTALTLPKNTQIRVLSPFRFPAIRTIQVSLVARVVGVFLVFIGGFFSLINFQYIHVSSNFVGIHKQLATTLDSTTTSTTTSTIISSGTTSTLSTTTDTTPDVQIHVESTDLTLSATVPISIVVPDAQEIIVIAEDRSTGNLLVLGNALRVDTTTWRYYWNTTIYPNGEYRIFVSVQNAFGNYKSNGTDTYTIRNTVTVTDSIVSTSTTTSGTTTIDSTTSTQVSLQISENNPLQGNVSIQAYTSKSDELSIYAQNIDTRIKYFIGFAVYHSGDEWRLNWNSVNIPNGNYNLFARSKIGTQYTNSPIIAKTIKNSEPIASSTTTIEFATTTPTPPQSSDQLTQKVTITLSKQSPLSNFVELNIDALYLDNVEIYALPKNSLTSFFIGSAQKITDTNWRYAWNTTQTPNGDYLVYAKVKNVYGLYESEKITTKVLNEVSTSLTDEQEILIDKLYTAGDGLKKITDNINVTQPTTQSDIQSDNTMIVAESTYIEPVDVFLASLDLSQFDKSTTETIQGALVNYRNSLDTFLVEYEKALRNNDVDTQTQIKADIDALQKKLMLSLSGTVTDSDIINKLNNYTSRIAFESQSLTEDNQRILINRIGEAVYKDSDSDEISDYDEVNLYKTNPFVADTDGDGYIDSSEITLGYNPSDSKSESYIAYDSAQDTGITRNDILYVKTISTIYPEDISADTSTRANPEALITGTGLPNSFVTLYIYSTPIVVTVKTDDSGSWSYIFDKELDDGNHTIYVGITDNSGKIIAKSNPLFFVKTAEAYTQIDQSNTLNYDASGPSLLNVNLLLLIGSLAIVSLGLALILLGIHVSRKKYPQPLDLVHE